jgi:multidrug efflux pump subunit AcrA (membrane-fusion protein)
MPQSRRRWPIRIALLAVALAAAGGAYRYWPRAQPTFLTLYGNVDVRQVDLAFNASGRLQALHKEEGDAVKAGETVAVMEADTYRDAVALARARLDAQRAVVDRLEAPKRLPGTAHRSMPTVPPSPTPNSCSSDGRSWWPAATSRASSTTRRRTPTIRRAPVSTFPSRSRG